MLMKTATLKVLDVVSETDIDRREYLAEEDLAKWRTLTLHRLTSKLFGYEKLGNSI